MFNSKKSVFLLFVWLTIALMSGGSSFSVGQEPPAPQKKITPTPTPTPTISNDDEPIKINTELVNILFTAEDKNRRLMTNLKQEDVRLLEDGTTQEISVFTRQTDLPLSLAILIDTSASMERTLPEAKAAANYFIEQVIRPAKDEAAVVSFTGEATLEQGMTGNVARLNRAIDRVKVVLPSSYLGGGVVGGTPPVTTNPALSSTAIWDAIWVTADEILSPTPETTRRAIILLTDGVNTYGQKKLNDAVQAALRAETVIYAIGIGDNYYDGIDKGVLRKITERTGGRAFFPENELELRKAFEQIQTEMRSQYLIAYQSSNQKLDGSYRKIEIQITNPQLSREKVKLTHRQGYFANTENQRK